MFNFLGKEKPISFNQSFKTPEEELEFLRNKIAEKEKVLGTSGVLEKEQIAKQTLENYSSHKIEDILHSDFSIKKEERDAFVLQLHPEPHDTKMEELLGLLLEKGILNTLQVVHSLKNPHISDDFHRFLVQYLIQTHTIPGLKETTSLHKHLSMKLFEITLPEKEISDTRSFKEIIGSVEQFFAGMQYVGGRENKDYSHYTIELAQSYDRGEVGMYVAVPYEQSELFEKQILSIHPNALLHDATDDYNIFVPNGQMSAAYATLALNDALPIKTFESLDHDPLQIILNVFSTFKKEGEGAAIQFLIRPEGDSLIKQITDSLEKVKKGEKLEKKVSFAEARNFGKEIVNAVSFTAVGKTVFEYEKEGREDDKEKQVDTESVRLIESKLSRSITSVNIRIICSAETENRAQQMIRDVESAFGQFTEPRGNSILFKGIEEKKELEISEAFIYREFIPDHHIAFNLRELASLIHFPYGLQGISQIKLAKSAGSPAPLTDSSGILLGYNNYRGTENPVYIKREDRMRHLYVVGQTGTGKTSILKNLIAQDIANGDGVCYIDPHGNDIQEILSYIPKERINDVIYFDPAHTARPMGLNMLEYDERFPEQKTFIINELINIFNQLFDMKTSGGPMFEQYFRNAAMLVMEDPESGSTLLEITRVLQDKAFRDYKLSKCNNPIVLQFWKSAEATTGEQGLQNFVPYISSKFDPFISNDIMRPVIGQQKSVFNFRKIMDEKKILLVNLSKGRLGEINANLIGLILVGKIQMAALSRTDILGKEHVNDFYLYIDEFQNVTTPAIASILSEARKYRLSLNVAHQYIAQLPEDIKNAVFGNVGSMCVFRVSPDDAKVFESKFTPTFTAQDISKLDNRNAYVSMIVDGAPTLKPFNIKTADNPIGNKEIIEPLKELSYLTYGRDRTEVEEEIIKKYR